jgi:hypothetical protein
MLLFTETVPEGEGGETEFLDALQDAAVGAVYNFNPVETHSLKALGFNL